jgi:hypothetical protein
MKEIPCENCICISICKSVNLLSEISKRCNLLKNYLNGENKEDDKFFILMTYDHDSLRQNISMFPGSDKTLDRIKKALFVLELKGIFDVYSNI